MKKLFVLCFLIGIYSCGSKSELSEDMQCKPEPYANLELVENLDKRFIVEIPKHWKTNLYFDKNQTSIFFADTTKQLTNSYIFDVTYIYEELQINQKFLERFKHNLMKNKLVESTSYELTFNNQEAYYSRALGKRGAFDYEILNLFIKANSDSYLHVKTEF